MRDTLRLKTGLPLLNKPTQKPSEVYYLLREYEPLLIIGRRESTLSSTSFHPATPPPSH
jgi:hypothetical protein